MAPFPHASIRLAPALPSAWPRLHRLQFLHCSLPAIGLCKVDFRTAPSGFCPAARRCCRPPTNLARKPGFTCHCWRVTMVYTS